MRLKVCGMTRIDQLKALEDIGVDYAGLIFYSRSPRYVLKNGLTPSLIKHEKLSINRVGVFVNESIENVLQIADEWKLHMVQLHGDESPMYCEQISKHVTTIKAFRIGENEKITYKSYPYVDHTDMFLFDTKSKQYGGSGQKFEWTQLKQQSSLKSYFLSGGIGPDDVEDVKQFCKGEQNLFSLDVNSIFETSPGVKDISKVKLFNEEIKS